MNSNLTTPKQRPTISSRPSLLGEAPNVREIRRNAKKGTINHAVTFWYFFRMWYPVIAIVALGIMYLIPALTAGDDISGYMLYGGVLSSIFCLCVMLSYKHVVPWRKHPSPLIFHRTVAHFLFSLILIFSSSLVHRNSDDASDACVTISFLTQFSFFAGECWLWTISIDLLRSLTNPFTSYKSNLRTYHIIVWLASLINATALVENTSCQGHFTEHICWIRIHDPMSSCFWGYYLGCFSLLVIAYAFHRLSKGLETTYNTRRICAQHTLTMVLSYVSYSILLLFLYLMLVEFGTNRDGEFHSDSPSIRHIKTLLAYFLSCRGFVDASLWFLMHTFESSGDSNGNILQQFFAKRDWRAPLLPMQHSASNTSVSSASPTRAETTSAAPSAVDDADLDLSPQLNLALREEVVHFVTRGIIQSVEHFVRHQSQSPTSTFALDEKHIFTDYETSLFHKLRKLYHISDDEYVHYISKPTKEKLAEGNSGAFMFYCGNGELIVKTINTSEVDTLLEILPTYYNYLMNNSHSLLVKFFGLHSLQMYNQTFYFIVMRNVFPSNVIVNQRYDIKGSWVNRNTGVIPPGKRIFCRHCGELFVSGSNERCPDIVGPHDPNTILKDNDMVNKIRLKPEDAYNLIDILLKDSDALCSMGITDYSMLVGVKNFVYDLDQDNIIKKSRNRDSLSTPTFEEYRPSEAGKVIDISEEDLQEGYIARSVIAPGVYYIGVIDILQKWTLQKKLERFCKVYLLGKSGRGLSAMPPVPYKERFQLKISQIIEHSIFIREVTGSWKGKREVSEPTSLIEM